MADNDNANKPAKKAGTTTTVSASSTGVFKLKPHHVAQGKFTIVSLSRKRSITINRGTSPIEHPMFKDKEGGKLPVATSEELKTVYDSNKVWAEYIDAPTGYNAPWKIAESN